MLRSLLLGVLVFSTASACKGSGDAPAVQPGVAVGKVVELSGEVSATRGTAKRPLATGQEISGDDVIETGAQATVRILFAHNNATWDLGPNKKQLVSESLAWKAPKANTPAGEVNEATLAAGRHAERETVTTGTTAAEPAPPTPTAAATPEASPAPGGGSTPDPRPRGDMDKGGRGGGGREEAASAEKRKYDDDDGLERAPAKELEQPRAAIAVPKQVPRKESPSTEATTTMVAPLSVVQKRIASERAQLVSCVPASSIELEIVVKDGATSFVLPAKASRETKDCFTKIAAKITFPASYNVRFKDTIAR